MQNVFTLTTCRDLDALYGSTTALQTLRIGFPNARITVADNASLPEAAGIIERLAADIGAAFHAIPQRMRHHEFLTSIFLGPPAIGGPTVVVDPDVAFWSSCEGWSFDELLAGKYIPTFTDEYSNTVQFERLHTSFFWCERPAAFRDALAALSKRYPDWEAFAPVMVPGEPRWTHHDVGATLYAALPGQMRAFGPAEQECFDHLYCGTAVAAVAPHLRNGSEWLALHDAVRHDVRALRGAWRFQDRHFAERRRL
jgi:hypothetical protein